MKKTVFLLFLVLFLVKPSLVRATEASLKCSPASGTYKVGDNFTVDYTLDTRSFPSFGAAVVATFDPGTLEAVGSQSTAVTSATSWGQPTTNTIDSVLGKITLDYGNAQPSYTGSTSIGQITFKAKTAGQAQFNYTFFQQYDDTTPGVAKVWGKKDGTNLSNILTDVNNCIYVIEAGAAPTPTTNAPIPTQPATVPTATSVPAPQVTELPRSGAVEVTTSLLAVAGFFVAAGGAVPFLWNRKKT